jgi:hypothetical protein
VETREWHHVDGEFAEIRIELTRESETGGDARHDGRDKMVKIAIRRVIELKGTHANVIQSLLS